MRLAEQIATLDVISGGRVDCGIGRGYQPRENETLGRPYGSTIQDQERNRKAFEEAIAIMKKCWTEPSFSHHGENFSVPPSYTKWNHKQTIAYFQQDKAGRRLEEVMQLGDPDMYSAGNPVQATTTTLKELQVFPQPVQKPHPQLWEPLTSARSLKFAAEHGINGVMIAEPNDRLRRNIEIYYEAAEKAGFPDMIDRGRFKFGWDATKRRGIMTSRYLHITRPGKEKQALERAARAIELQFDYYGPFGFRRRRGASRRADVRSQQKSDRRDAARARDRNPRLQAVRHRQDHEDAEASAAMTISASSAGSSSAGSTPRRSRSRCRSSPKR